MMREKERKRLIKLELDKQLGEKEVRKMRTVDEDRMYEGLQKQHISLLERREMEKNEEMRRKILQEKMSRDKQLKEEKKRRKRENKEQFESEVEMVKRLQSEMEQERYMLLEKKTSSSAQSGSDARSSLLSALRARRARRIVRTAC